MIGFVPAGYIIVSADVAHLSVLIHKAVVLLFAILSTAFMNSNPHKCREESSVIKWWKAWRYYWKKSIGPQKNDPQY